MKFKVLVVAVLFTVIGVSGASAATIGLFEYAFNINGIISNPKLGNPIPGGVSIAGFDTTTGLGTISITRSGAGAHYVGLFVDHEIDEAINTFFNEYGSPGGPPPGPGRTWEIDEPGYFFGDIYDNFLAGSLDGLNGVPDGSPDDVSMAWGWSFNLAAGETATITLALANTAPALVPYLVQTDPDSDASIYFSGDLTIRGGGEPPIPEPATMLLLGSGLIGLAGYGRKKFFKK